MNNKFVEHVVICAEDPRTKQLAQGFVESNYVNDARCEVYHSLRHGWTKVHELVEELNLRKYAKRYVVLFIDFDQCEHDHAEKIRAKIADVTIEDRVFIIGASGEVEDLKRQIGMKFNLACQSYNSVGCLIADQSASAADCRRGVWSIEQLKNNDGELARLCRLKNIIFNEKN